MSVTVVLVCGVQGSGKSWICRQLGWKFRYIPHDRCWTHPLAEPGPGLDVEWGPSGSTSTHLPTLVAAAREKGAPLLTEAPFGERTLRDALTKSGLTVVPVFVVEDASVLAARYRKREGREIPSGVLTRAAALRDRALAWGCFCGSSAAVLSHLKTLKISP